MPLLIVEGPDGSGKSTLIDEIAQAAPDDTITLHCGPLKTHPLVEYDHQLRVIPRGKTILCDRWHVGELIYGPLYRGRSELTPAMTRYIELVLASRGALRVYVDTPVEVIQERLATRGEDFLKPEHLGLVHDFYHEYAAVENWHRVTPGYSRKRLPVSLLREAQTLAERAESLGRFKTYIGPPRPTTLLLGETRAKPKPGRPLTHGAFAPYTDSSGHYLFSALEQAKPFNSYGLANALDESLKALYLALGRPKVITLGNSALAECQRYHIPVTADFPHPQYVRRFTYRGLAGYGQKIRDVIDS